MESTEVYWQGRERTVAQGCAFSIGIDRIELKRPDGPQAVTKRRRTRFSDRRIVDGDAGENGPLLAVRDEMFDRPVSRRRVDLHADERLRSEMVQTLEL